MQGSRLRTYLTNVGLMILSLLLTFAMGELALRLYHLLRYDAPFFSGSFVSVHSAITIDDEIGWRATENFINEYTTRSEDGTAYRVHISQNEYGFRLFGSLESTTPKILVIGDSFTQAVQVSDEKTYYAIIGDKLGVEVFAYGVQGYGTLQEYMILDRYLDMVSPHVILWQYCSNDFINNLYELEIDSKRNNAYRRRPYWVHGEVKYLLPKRETSLRTLALEKSRMLEFIISRLDKIYANSEHTVERKIERLGIEHQGFRESVQVTDQLMAMVRARAGDIPIVAFDACSATEPYQTAFLEISTKNDILFITTFQAALLSAESNGVLIRSKDKTHWNGAGHQLAGEIISAFLSEAHLARAGVQGVP